MENKYLAFCLLSVKVVHFGLEPSLIVVCLMHVSLRLLKIIGSINFFTHVDNLLSRSHTALIDGNCIMLEVTALFVIGVVILSHLQAISTLELVSDQIPR